MGIKTLRPELFGEVTIVRACLHVRARVLGFCGPVEAQAPYSPPGSRGAHVENMSTHRSISNKEKIKLTIKILHSGAAAQSFSWKTEWFVTLGLAKESLPCRGMGTTFGG